MYPPLPPPPHTHTHTSVVPEPNQACVTKDFGGHTCPSSCSGMTDISSSSITTSAECIAACCADPKIKVCTYAGFQDATKTCIAGDWQPCPSCTSAYQHPTLLPIFFYHSTLRVDLNQRLERETESGGSVDTEDNAAIVRAPWWW